MAQGPDGALVLADNELLSLPGDVSVHRLQQGGWVCESSDGLALVADGAAVPGLDGWTLVLPEVLPATVQDVRRVELEHVGFVFHVSMDEEHVA
jgi:hypothetical protein